ncbi:MAG TPA: NAD(P)/FAD-dependent oxidoreductase [Candidatus Thermoplasmatota archaeon]|nr:NAD(P)/FAD-dependent oxidoreductase [Candidatus Thermoplasmatota archaeon]
MAARPLDVRIVGGGFAGVVTALTLLKGRHAVDARVTIYEREARAHTTLCGEGLSEDTLRAFDAFDSAPYVAESFDEALWRFPGGLDVRIHQRGHTMARERWIPAMAEEAARLGAEYRTGVKVSPGTVEAMAREADLVVGADGPGSVARRVVGGRHETMLGIQYRVAREGRVPDRLVFVTDKRFSPEYSWVFPRGDILNVGLLAAGDGADWERLDAFAKEEGVTGKVLKREAYPIGFFGDRVQKGNVVLVGDAAGLTNPITKGGMSAVVHAAAILARCVKEGRLADYEREVRASPLCDRSFAPALAALRRWTNEDYARLTRFAPRTVHVRPGSSTERRHALRYAASLLANLPRAREMTAVARAFGVARAWSW